MNAVANLVDVQIARPDNTAATRAREALDAARALVIETPEQYTAAVHELQAVKGKWNQLEAERKNMVAPINEAKNRVQHFFAGPEGPQTFLAEHEGVLKLAITNYQREQERLRQEEQRKLEEQARRERAEIEARARETERKARELAEADRRAAAQLAAAGRAEEAARLNARADSKETKAAEKASALEQRAAAVVAPAVQREAPKVAGLKTREVWKFEIVDPSLLPREYLVPDEAAIRGVVNSLKDRTKIPGVRVFPDKSQAASSR